MAKMTDADLRALIMRRRDASVTLQKDSQKVDAREALQFYRGDNLALYGNSGDGLSTVVSRDLLEAVESMLPGLIKPFVSGDEFARFDPTGPEDEEGAKQATEYVNWIFTNHNDAFRVVYDFMKDGLLQRIGVAKVVHETVTDKSLETYKGLAVEAVQALEADKDHEIVGDVIQDEDGTFEVRCSRKVESQKFRVYIVAPEEFLFENRLANLEDARFLGHRSTKPIGDFVAMGLDKKKCMDLRASNRDDFNTDDRFGTETLRPESGDSDDDLARLVTVDECYVRCDYEGTGTLAWRKVFVGANDTEVLSNEEAEDHPYCVWTPVPIPHKLVGMSVHDLVRDVQMTGTALIREALNGLYLANKPQREVVQDQVNIEDLLNPEVGGIVRVKSPGMIREIASGGEGVAQQALQMIEHNAGIREQRTGSTRYNQGMDANSLNKTATGISIIQNASTQRAELIARQFAESGMKTVFKKLLALVCRHQNKKEVVRLRGQWVEMDPAAWNTGYDLTVTVGLGTGNREAQIGQLTNLLQMDKEIITLQGGAQGPIVTMQNVYEKLKRMVEAMGLKGIEHYYDDPSSPSEGEQRREDPQAAQQAAQQAEIDKFKAESALELEKAKLKAHTDIEIAKIKAETDLIIAGMKAANDPMETPGLGGEEEYAEPQQEYQEQPQEMAQEAMPQDYGMEMPQEPQMVPDGGEMLPDEGYDTGMMPQ